MRVDASVDVSVAIDFKGCNNSCLMIANLIINLEDSIFSKINKIILTYATRGSTPTIFNGYFIASGIRYGYNNQSVSEVSIYFRNSPIINEFEFNGTIQLI